MDLSEYQKEVLKNFKPRRQLSEHESALLDWTLGIAGEAGEIIDVIQHNIFHQQPMDKMELAKEIGDCLWYLTALCEELEFSMSDCAELNIAKLRYRHGGTFSYERSAQKSSTEKSFKDTQEFADLKWRIEHGR